MREASVPINEIVRGSGPDACVGLHTHVFKCGSACDGGAALSMWYAKMGATSISPCGTA